MFKADTVLFHTIDIDDGAYGLPEQFTYPFYYQPHPLCVKAADELKGYLSGQTDFEHNFGLDDSKGGLKIGKMFGVMLIETLEGELGYIVAFSGKLAESNFLAGFVPPVYNNLDTEGFYKKGEAQLNGFNSAIDAFENASEYVKAKERHSQLKQEYERTLIDFKDFIKSEKKKRAQKRLEAKENLPENEFSALLDDLKKQSIYYHFRLKDLKKEWQVKIEQDTQNLTSLEAPIKQLKLERKTLSSRLQKQLHEQYQFLNYKGETKDLIDIFEKTNVPQPPAGAGECAAPKLFQYAFENDLKPLAMAEFWWGSSPKSEVRQHGQFYPSCRGKCEPILGHMMTGLDVEPNPITKAGIFEGELEIVFEDDYMLLVNKPHEFLSVPGKTIDDSVLTRMRTYLPAAKGPLLVHRLDMSTSGLLLVAKNEKTHKNLQKQFIARTIKKRYVALLHGELDSESGIIDLPLRVDLNNRPRQLVCYEHGKPAKTKYEVVNVTDGKTRIHFYPISGRTHQLRVHAAHHLGLNVPIVGDDLYGNLSNRLHLHAETLGFEHPVKREWMTFSCEAPF